MQSLISIHNRFRCSIPGDLYLQGRLNRGVQHHWSGNLRKQFAFISIPFFFRTGLTNFGQDRSKSDWGKPVTVDWRSASTARTSWLFEACHFNSLFHTWTPSLLLITLGETFFLRRLWQRIKHSAMGSLSWDFSWLWLACLLWVWINPRYTSRSVVSGCCWCL